MTTKHRRSQCQLPGSVLLLSLGMLCLSAACGRDERPSVESSTPQGQTPGGEIDPCPLVTGAEAEQALAAPAGDPERPGEAN
jgi:hypothetical protein